MTVWKKLRVGDVLLIKGASVISPLIRWLTRCSFTHTAIVINETQIIEATADWEKGDTGNVRITPIKYYAGNDKIVLRPQITFRQRMLIIKTALSKLHQPYDTLGFFLLGLKHWFGINSSRPRNKHTCISLIRSSFRKAGLHLNYALPINFLNSKKFRKVQPSTTPQTEEA